MQRAAFHSERALELVERGQSLIEAVNVAAHPAAHALMCLRGELLADLGAIPACVDVYRSALAIAPDDAGRARALLGLAGALRISEGFDEALGLLDAAEAIARAHDRADECSRIAPSAREHLFHARQVIDACRQQHEHSLAMARRSGAPESEALALGGLGDAAYAVGRMRSAHAHFHDCVTVSREHGFARIEVANRSMVGFSGCYLNQTLQALEDGVGHSARQAAQLGHLRAEMLGETMGMLACVELGRFEDALQHVERSRRLAQRLGAHRFEMQNLEIEGRALLALGQRDAAVLTLRRAVSLGRDVGLQFCGPKTMSALAIGTQDGAERLQMLAEGAALLARGAVGHNHLWFYRDAIEAGLASADPVAMRRHADALEDYTQAEPLPWSRLFAARGRALAAALEGPVAEALATTLVDIRTELLAAGLQPYIAACHSAARRGFRL